MAEINAPVFVDGTLSAANIKCGVVTITPTPGSPTGFPVSGLTLAGSGELFVQVTPQTAYPGGTVLQTAVGNRTGTGFTVWIVRSNDTPTNLWWIATRSP